MRKLKIKKIVVATALALSGMVLVVSAHAAGLGRINVMSGLGQPLRAEIALTSVSRDEAGSLTARLASPAAYREAGRDFNASLMNVRMVVERRPDGQYFIRLNSTVPLNDPIVDLLVDLTWANGRLLREYTFLLDPVDMRPAPVSPPAASEPKPAASTAQAAPAVPPVAASLAPPLVAAPAPVRPDVQPKRAAAPSSYAVKKGDTAGKIARQALSGGVTLDQMLVAIQRANQDAFIAGNVNRLKSGVIITIPDKEAAAAVTPADARRLVAAQSSDWKMYAEKLAAGVRVAPAAQTPAERRDARGRITARVEGKAVPGATGDQLKLSKPDPAAVAKGTPKPRAGVEDSISKERELRDTKARQAELERNVKDLRDLQKLAEVKSQSLADLQKSAQAKGAPVVAQGSVTVPAAVSAKAEAPKVAQVPAPAVTPAAPPAGPAKAEAAKVEAPQTVAAVTAKAPEPAKTEAPKVAPVAAPASGAVASKDAVPPRAAEPVEPVKAPDPAKAIDAKPAEPPKAEAKPGLKGAAQLPVPPKPEPTLVDEFLDNPLYLVGGGGVLALLGAYAAYAVRRKRKDASTGFQNGIVTGGDLKANSVFGSTDGQGIDIGNSSLQSDLSTAGAPAVDTDEVDPIAEADVYLAYGRDAQAEETLKLALQKDPQRQAVHAKLLDIYSQRGDVNAFGATAAQLHAATGGSGTQWERAAALGKALDPSNALYGAGTAAAALASGDSVATLAFGAGALSAAASAAAVLGDKTVSLSADGSPGAAPISADDPLTKTVLLEAMQGETPASIDLDFDLGSDTSALAPNTAALSFDADPPAAQSFAQDVSPQGMWITDAPVATDSGAAPADKTVEILKVGEGSPPADHGMSVDLDFDLGSSEPAAPVASAPATTAGNIIDFDFGDVSLELSDGGGGTEAAPTDDVATKLDLAKAYQEIGDKDGAKELLKEVMAEGSSAQQAEAQEILSGLG